MNLITDISQIRGVSKINISNTLDVWQPYIDEAEELFIKPVIGEALFEEIQQKIDSPESGSGEDLWSELIDKVRKPLSLYALYVGADELAVSISSSGIQTISSETHRPASQYQIQNLKESWIRRAHTAMDSLLVFLEAHKETFTSYVSTENELFIPNAAEFDKWVNIRKSRRVYIALKPVIRSIERKYIRPTLSKELFDELKAELNGSGSAEISEATEDLLDLIRPALAHLTMARALNEISIDILDWGVFGFAQNTFDNVQGKQAANQEQISAMINACQGDGEAELKELQEFLDENASGTLYASYYASDRYVGADEAKTRSEFENSEDNAIFLI